MIKLYRFWITITNIISNSQTISIQDHLGEYRFTVIARGQIIQKDFRREQQYFIGEFEFYNFEKFECNDCILDMIYELHFLEN